MGVWGAGNFDNDMAGEFLDDVTLQLVKNIEDAVALHNQNNLDLDEHFDGLVMPSIDVLVTLCTHYQVSPMVDETKIREWKSLFMSYYDVTIDQYGAKEPYKQNRRKVIDDTFDKLADLSRLYY